MLKIELPKFLKWAFGEELAHVASDGGGRWSAMAAFAALGTVVDTSGSLGGVPELANVHPDALRANEAVMLLAGDRDLVLPEGWNPFPDLDDPHGLIAASVRDVLDRRALRLASDINNNLIATVIALSVMGKMPDWTAEQPKFQMVTKPNGTPAWFLTATQTDVLGRVYEYETDGYNAKSGRPVKGAYRKYAMAAGFGGAVQARIDWYLWSLAMERIAERLSGLKSHVILPLSLPRAPWQFSSREPTFAQGIEIAAE